jgi:trimeric autotransporter adhesin
MYSNTKGQYNTALGGYAGFKNVRGNKNVFIGWESGLNEKGSNKLYISNSKTKKPLIYGEFNTKIVKVNGKMYATRYITSSDMRLKRDIQPLSGALASVMKLQGKTYRLKEDTTDTPTIDIGLIAQDVEKIFPQLVTEDEQNYKGVDYSKLTVVLIEAMKEQQGQIMILEKENTELKALVSGQMEKLLARVAMLEGNTLAEN